MSRRLTPLSGMSTNITISLAFSITAYIGQNQTNHFKYLWIYIFGDLLGMYLAFKYYDEIYEPLIISARLKKKDIRLINIL
jgi:glycerol uptake facilitator-like aquaporin